MGHCTSVHCGARTRKGTACLRKALSNGRCPNHGGLSTGPRTEAGKQRISEAQKSRWVAWRSQRSTSQRPLETSPQTLTAHLPGPPSVSAIPAMPLVLQPVAARARALPTMTVNPGRNRYGR